LQFSEKMMVFTPFHSFKKRKIKPFLFTFLQSSLSRKYNACFVES